ncbi:hypothetical protein LL998_02505 [Burkholderia ambifaria]|uniref:hypothetical protein n=1 Tax=Burkholderia ambifaria TaxID=152480 RepID=UPI001E4C7A6F|nr:hypothetical protein [Burkholderia ambifaria]UEP35181.1 hypothetical protein LL998_02505 [Burkholderia ambifaria]
MGLFNHPAGNDLGGAIDRAFRCAIFSGRRIRFNSSQRPFVIARAFSDAAGALMPAPFIPFDSMATHRSATLAARRACVASLNRTGT